MKQITSILAGAAFSLTLFAPAHADDLREAMETSLTTNPALAAARARVDSVREALPLAWAESLPQISANFGAVSQHSSEPSASAVRGAPRYWSSSLNTSTLLFAFGAASAGRREARAQIASAVSSFEEATQQVLLEVTAAYADVIAAHAVHEAQNIALENLELQLRHVDANQRRGFLTRTDVALAQARLEQARATFAVADMRMVQAVEAYLRIVGAPPGDLAAPDDIAGLPENLAAAFELAAENSHQIHAAIGALNAADASVDAAAARGRARVTLETANNYYETWDQPLPCDCDEEQISLRITVPLFSGGAARADTRRERALRRAANFDLSATQAEVRERVASAWASLAASRATLAASQAQVTAAELAHRGMRREQQAGLRSTIDVLNQEQDLLDARTSLARAQRDYTVAQRELAASVGLLRELSLPNLE